MILEHTTVIQPFLSHRSIPAATVELIATLDEPDSVGDGAIRKLPDEVSWLQVRADRVGDIPSDRLRQEFGGKLLYSLGSGEGDDAADADGLNRSKRLSAANLGGYDLIELDGERDIDADLLAAIPPERRLISWRGAAATASELMSRFRRISSIARTIVSPGHGHPARCRTGWRRCCSCDRRGAAT